VDDERFLERLLSQGLSFAVKAALRIGKELLKRLIAKLLAWLLALLAPYLIPILAILALFFFVYGAICILPRYITEGGSGAPGVVEAVATGYVPGDNPDGTKRRGKRGMVVADPDLIKPGTKLYVPGYGYGVARTGLGAQASGNKVMLCFDDADEAGEWQNKTVRIKLFGGKSPTESPAILSFGESDIWTLAQDEKLFETYLKLDADWFGQFAGQYTLDQSHPDRIAGNAADKDATVGEIWGDEAIAEKPQVQPHRVKWSFLAALDRVLGDPVVHGAHGSEDLGQGRRPEPEKHFAEFKPELKWEQFNLYYEHRWSEKTTDSQNNTSYKTYTKIYEKKIKLLTFASTYEADFTYTWERKVTETEHHYSDGTFSYKKVITPELKGVQRRNVYERLMSVLREYGLEKPSNAETVLQIAAHMDDEFAVDSSLFGSFTEMLAPEDFVFTGDPGAIIWPAGGPVISGYGYRIHPILGTRRMHTGIDIGVPTGEPVCAAAAGIVEFCGEHRAWGKCIRIDHGEFQTFYAHLDSIQVRPGMEVDSGQVIGKAGSTGWSSGPHLHFEVWQNGTHVNPLSWLQNT